MPSIILIVDDSVTILMSMEAILARGGFTVTTAASGEDAMAKLQKGAKPALIITDIHMGQMNGIELIKKVASWPAFSSFRSWLSPPNRNNRNVMKRVPPKPPDGW